MSGIYIPGMGMPQRDEVITIYPDGTAHRHHLRLRLRISESKAIPVPEHGRLIDADALLNLLNHCMFPSDMVTTTAVSMATNWIQNAPTVIPADEEAEK